MAPAHTEGLSGGKGITPERGCQAPGRAHLYNVAEHGFFLAPLLQSGWNVCRLGVARLGLLYAIARWRVKSSGPGVMPPWGLLISAVDTAVP